jgi:hypothetical protein
MKYHSNELRTLARAILDVEMRFDLPGLSDEFYTATPDEFLRSPNVENETDKSVYDETLALDLSRAFFNNTKLGTDTAFDLENMKYSMVNSLREMAHRIDLNEDENTIDIFKTVDAK